MKSNAKFGPYCSQYILYRYCLELFLVHLLLITLSIQYWSEPNPLSIESRTNREPCTSILFCTFGHGKFIRYICLEKKTLENFFNKLQWSFQIRRVFMRFTHWGKTLCDMMLTFAKTEYLITFLLTNQDWLYIKWKCDIQFSKKNKFISNLQNYFQIWKTFFFRTEIWIPNVWCESANLNYFGTNS